MCEALAGVRCKFSLKGEGGVSYARAGDYACKSGGAGDDSAAVTGCCDGESTEVVGGEKFSEFAYKCKVSDLVNSWWRVDDYWCVCEYAGV